VQATSPAKGSSASSCSRSASQAFPGLPFGGYKQSGFGREGSLETIEMYLETKAVFVSTGDKPVNPWGL
jgi:acyl-CoA reductase-like NAD-dependent aldehyde dehydrogenase